MQIDDELDDCSDKVGGKQILVSELDPQVIISEESLAMEESHDKRKKPVGNAISLSGYDEDSYMEESMGYMKANAAYDSTKVIHKIEVKSQAP